MWMSQWKLTLLHLCLTLEVEDLFKVAVGIGNQMAVGFFFQSRAISLPENIRVSTYIIAI